MCITKKCKVISKCFRMLNFFKAIIYDRNIVTQNCLTNNFNLEIFLFHTCNGSTHNSIYAYNKNVFSFNYLVFMLFHSHQNKKSGSLLCTENIASLQRAYL